MTLTWPGLTKDVEHICYTCQVCQLTNKERQKYGLLPPKIAESDPWVVACVDLMGHLIIQTPSKIHSLLTLTTINPAKFWFKIVKAIFTSVHTLKFEFKRYFFMLL